MVGLAQWHGRLAAEGVLVNVKVKPTNQFQIYILKNAISFLEK